jgi:hypothetical protein
MILDVAVEARLSSSHPILGVVVVGSGPRSQKAEKDVTGGSDDNARVSGPDDHVTGLRVGDLEKSFNAVVKIGGTRVGVGKARALINGVNKVRAVVGGIAGNLGVERGGDDGQTVVCGESLIRFASTASARVLA